MKPKLQYQIQPGKLPSTRSEQFREEVKGFLQAVNSYPARVAEEPSLSFYQHLRSFFGTARNIDRESRPRQD
jgi:hypothetical protein